MQNMSQSAVFMQKALHVDFDNSVIVQLRSIFLFNFFNVIWIYLLFAIGLTPGGSSTVHIYTQTIYKTTLSTQNNTQNNTIDTKIHRTTLPIQNNI